MTTTAKCKLPSRLSACFFPFHRPTPPHHRGLRACHLGRSSMHTRSAGLRRPLDLNDSLSGIRGESAFKTQWGKFYELQQWFPEKGIPSRVGSSWSPPEAERFRCILGEEAGSRWDIRRHDDTRYCQAVTLAEQQGIRELVKNFPLPMWLSTCLHFGQDFRISYIWWGTLCSPQCAYRLLPFRSIANSGLKL